MLDRLLTFSIYFRIFVFDTFIVRKKTFMQYPATPELAGAGVQSRESNARGGLYPFFAG
jgi:hypothetical protein